METSHSTPFATQNRIFPAVLLLACTAQLMACLYFAEYAVDTGTPRYQVFDQVFERHPALSGTAQGVIDATLVMLIPMLMGTLALLSAALKQTAPTRRGNRRLALGGVCAAVLFLVLLVRTPDLRLPSGPHGTLEILALLTAALLLTLVLLRADVSSRLLRLVLLSFAAAALAMSASVIALVRWLTGLSLAAPALFNGPEGAFGLNVTSNVFPKSRPLLESDSQAPDEVCFCYESANTEPMVLGQRASVPSEAVSMWLRCIQARNAPSVSRVRLVFPLVFHRASWCAIACIQG